MAEPAAGGGLSKNFHGAPVWVWAVGGGAVVVGGYRLWKSRQSSSSTATAPIGAPAPYTSGFPFDTGAGSGLSGGGGLGGGDSGGGGSTSPATPPTPTGAAGQAVAQSAATGQPASVSTPAGTAYLTAPSSAPGATNDASQLMTLQGAGAVPQGTVGYGGPANTVTGYMQSGLGNTPLTYVQPPPQASAPIQSVPGGWSFKTPQGSTLTLLQSAGYTQAEAQAVANSYAGAGASSPVARTTAPVAAAPATPAPAKQWTPAVPTPIPAGTTTRRFW